MRFGSGSGSQAALLVELESARSRDDFREETSARVARDLLRRIADLLSDGGALCRSVRTLPVVVDACDHELEEDSEGDLEDWVEWLIEEVVDGCHQIVVTIFADPREWSRAESLVPEDAPGARDVGPFYVADPTKDCPSEPESALLCGGGTWARVSCPPSRKRAISIAYERCDECRAEGVEEILYDYVDVGLGGVQSELGHKVSMRDLLVIGSCSSGLSDVEFVVLVVLVDGHRYLLSRKGRWWWGSPACASCGCERGGGSPKEIREVDA